MLHAHERGRPSRILVLHEDGDALEVELVEALVRRHQPALERRAARPRASSASSTEERGAWQREAPIVVEIPARVYMRVRERS